MSDVMSHFILYSPRIVTQLFYTNLLHICFKLCKYKKRMKTLKTVCTLRSVNCGSRRDVISNDEIPPERTQWAHHCTTNVISDISYYSPLCSFIDSNGVNKLRRIQTLLSFHRECFVCDDVCWSVSITYFEFE